MDNSISLPAEQCDLNLARRFLYQVENSASGCNHIMTTLSQFLHDMSADEAVGTSDNNSHGLRPIPLTMQGRFEWGPPTPPLLIISKPASRRSCLMHSGVKRQ